MTMVRVGDVELYYEVRRTGDEPLLMLICGLGGQVTSWDEGFCDDLRERGFGLLLFDNRDTGLSTSFDEAGTPEIDLSPGAGPPVVPYTLLDMADDAAGLLEAIGIDSVHVAGISMGGMIAQQLAISDPQRVLSLCSIMSAPSAQDVGAMSDAVIDVLLTPSPPGRDEFLDSQEKVWKTIGSPGFPFNAERIRDKAAVAYDRSFLPEGVSRQLAAILVSPSRTEDLRNVKVPTLVIHGDSDPLISPDGGRATAAAVPGSRLVIIPGMGHDLNPEVWSEIADAITENAGLGAPSSGASGLGAHNAGEES
jgi:pimeloyl-ACP methyl ester carboxylesterase